MRIDINASILDDKPSGLGTYTLNVVPRLAQLAAEDGHKVHIYSSFPEAFAYQEASGDITIRKVPKSVQPKYGKKAAVARLAWTSTVFPRAARRADIAYSTTHHGFFSESPTQVVTVHDVLPVMFPDQRIHQKWYYTYILPRVLKTPSAVITVSKSTQQDLQELYQIPSDRIYVVYNGIDHSHLRMIHDHEIVEKIRRKYDLTRYLLVVGPSYPYKNISKTLQAFSKVSHILPDLEVVIVGGRKEYTTNLKYEAKNLHIKCVRFFDYVSAEELPVFYSAATALVYPSLYEGFGLPPLEAMACGCPVIVSKTSSLPEVCGDAACYVDPYSADSIAEAMYKVVKDENFRNHLREKGLERARVFTWDKTAQGVYEVLKTVYRERCR